MEEVGAPSASERGGAETLDGASGAESAVRSCQLSRPSVCGVTGGGAPPLPPRASQETAIWRRGMPTERESASKSVATDHEPGTARVDRSTGDALA